MFELTEEQRKQLLQYLWSRPYGEVASYYWNVSVVEE